MAFDRIVDTNAHCCPSMVSSLDVHRLFLQSAISRRVLSAELAKVIWKQCVEAVEGRVLCPIPLHPHSKVGNKTAADATLQINASIANNWDEFLAGLNKSLDPLDLELSRIRNEVTGKEMYALVRCFALPAIHELQTWNTIPG